MGLAAACAVSRPAVVSGPTVVAEVADSAPAPNLPIDTLLRVAEPGVPVVDSLPTITAGVLDIDSVSVSTDPEAAHEVRICAGGDVLLGNNLDTTWAVRASSRLGVRVPSVPDADRLLEPLRPLVADADIVLVNIEGAVGEGAATPKCRPRAQNCYAFRQPAATGEALRSLNVTAAFIGNVANNHAMDAGALGFEATQQNLSQAGVYVTGADTLATVVPTANGDTIAFLGFSTAQAGPDPRDLPAVRRHVERAAARYARVVVTMHMGAEGVGAQRTVDATERYLGEDRGNPVAFARAAVDAGASVVFGHGPLVMRAVEWYRGGLILYSLGNLLTYGPFSLAEPLNRGGIACVVLASDGQVRGAALRATWQRPPGIVEPDPTGRAAWLVDSLGQIDFPASAPRLLGEALILPLDSLGSVGR
jgi:hypothetical protein